MAHLIDLVGLRFARLTVKARAASPAGRTEAYWLCQCDCGGATQAKGRDLRTGITKSCGCLLTEKNNPKRIKHGLSRTSEYQTWRNIRQRCQDADAVNFEYYGGRGIRVCERWQDFELFYADMGPKPSRAHTIERINNDGHYEPSNCRWATMSEQQANRRPLRTAHALRSR